LLSIWGSREGERVTVKIRRRPRSFISSSSSSLIMSLSVLFEKIRVFPCREEDFLRLRRIEMKGVIPAPPAMKTPGPLYLIAPKTSEIINSSEGTKDLRC